MLVKEQDNVTVILQYNVALVKEQDCTVKPVLRATRKQTKQRSRTNGRS